MRRMVTRGGRRLAQGAKQIWPKVEHAVENHLLNPKANINITTLMNLEEKGSLAYGNLKRAARHQRHQMYLSRLAGELRCHGMSQEGVQLASRGDFAYLSEHDSRVCANYIGAPVNILQRRRRVVIPQDRRKDSGVIDES